MQWWANLSKCKQMQVNKGISGQPKNNKNKTKTVKRE